jgi:hypothetical protein
MTSGSCQLFAWPLYFPLTVRVQLWLRNGFWLDFCAEGRTSRIGSFVLATNIIIVVPSVAAIVFILGGTALRDSKNSEWIGNAMRTMIYLFCEHVKIVRIQYFSDHSKFPPKFRTLIILIVSQLIRTHGPGNL